MHSMTQEQDPVVIGGVDAHADIHHAAALDARGALLGTRQFAATSAGYEQLFEWASDACRRSRLNRPAPMRRV